MPNAIKAKESVVNLATPQSDEAKAIMDNCMEFLIDKKFYQIIYNKLNYLLKVIVFPMSYYKLD